jgi:hypothetical protein
VEPEQRGSDFARNLYAMMRLANVVQQQALELAGLEGKVQRE